MPDVANKHRLTLKQVDELMHSDGPYQRARGAFSSHMARIEQAELQSKPPSMIETRRMEFEAVDAIITAMELDGPRMARVDASDVALMTHVTSMPSTIGEAPACQHDGELHREFMRPGKAECAKCGCIVNAPELDKADD